MRSVLRREKRVMVQLEEPIMDLLDEVTTADDSTYSTFMRKLLLRHLVTVGKLGEEDLFKLLTA